MSVDIATGEDDSFLGGDPPRKKDSAARAENLRQLRKRMDVRNTDKTYRSGDVSALGSEGPPPKPASGREENLRQLRNRMDVRNTDRYYRSQTVQPKTRQQLELEARQAQRARRPSRPAQRRGPEEAAGHGDDLVMAKDQIRVDSAESCRAAAAHAVELLHKGVAPVRIGVGGPPLLALRVGSILDAMVGREEITEDQRRDILIAVDKRKPAEAKDAGGDAVAALPEPKPAPPKPVPDERVDPEAFLAAESVEEDGELPPEMPVQEADADDDNDFLAADAHEGKI